ncbi:DNA gyrase/topoisomerase IV subunit A [Hymenobacter taeanensis]|uniref:DNA gyrase/topoisomerase IV subunit A n=1 Tax=Hymenobacter taeanensis TaxID=2735321 RepID=A0A6M6BJ54_9BACT|nr:MULTISPECIES: DNA gyrase/topoisomerase IV subunit A [Hymenobacter]QJX48581.1 DNA gyrase/topoisomerase IV subunit A [Hymenobacter taeanensis]UOQ81919.1 DNA gyrase/topoisomerase IV subunit A [Hymenobacter sp. 5414T-23]
MSEETNPQDPNQEEQPNLFGSGDSFEFGSAPDQSADAETPAEEPVQSVVSESGELLLAESGADVDAVTEPEPVTEETEEEPKFAPGETIHDVATVNGMYQNWFLDYASYVILERAVPAIEDGLKPVQRRILHAMKEMDDGRFNKVANVIGQTMQYHPHGDASIGDAMVNLGQKDLLIETQGNWGDIRTGDGAAAPRYIEARLSKFALDVVFNPDITEWQMSYDGRKREPTTLPVKFPLLLAQGVEGIAVGLSTKIMPHNFRELCKASIDVLRGRDIQLFPDFPTGGLCDVSNYNGGLRGSKIRLRATIEKADKTMLVIRDIPYGTTTTALMESIVKASEANKIKIKKVVDNTAAEVEIQVHLPTGVSPDLTMDALYAFTDCEISISPNTCVIIEDKPRFVAVEDMLRLSTQKTVRLLERELEIRQEELQEKWHSASLEKIFIENRIYRKIEECETWEDIIQTIDAGLKKFVRIEGEKPKANDTRIVLRRAVTEDDITRLTEIRIKRISKYDGFKAEEYIQKLETELLEVADHLANIVRYAIHYFEGLLKKYGATRERKTQLRTFDVVTAQKVAVANQKLYVNRRDGFVGYGLKKDEHVEYICDCSDLDDIIAIKRDGTFMVSKIAEKTFVGKDIMHAGVYNKNDDRLVYNMIYQDGTSGISFAKRFLVTGITRDKSYDLTKGTKGTKTLYLTANPNSESEIVSVQLSDKAQARVKQFDFDFAELAIKGKGSMGNIVTKQPIKKITQKSLGDSTLGGREVFFDSVVGRLNTAGHGRYLGTFDTDNTILVVYKDGSYEMKSPDPAHHFDVPNIVLLRKLEPETVISAVYAEGETKTHYVKRFKIETSTLENRFTFISATKGSKLLCATCHAEPQVEVKLQRDKKADKETEKILLHEFIDVKGWKAMGNKLNFFKIHAVTLLTDEGPEPQRREVAKKRGPATIPRTNSPVSADAAPLPEHTGDVDISAADVAQAQAVLKTPKSQLKLF